MTHIQLFLLGSVLAVAVAGTYIFWGPSKRKQKKSNVPGLQNLGNTCFLNAILQALAACPLFINWLKKVIDQKHGEKGIAHSLCSVLLSMLEDLNSNFGLCSASDIVIALQRQRWVISNDEQDAHELFHVLTATIEEETDNTPPMLSLLEVSKLEPSKDEDKYCRPVLRNLRNTLPVRGLLANQLICQQCGYKYPVKYDTFDSISLTIPSPQWGPLTLQDCLKKFVSCEQVSDVTCDFCSKNPLPPATKQKNTFIKQISVGKLPECLCFHLQRTVWMSNIPVKCFDHIIFPEFLTMDSFMYKCPYTKSKREGISQVSLIGGSMEGQDRSQNNEVTQPFQADISSNSSITQLLADKSFHASDHLYILKAVVVHVGDVLSGHFVTYRRHSSNKKWFFASDSSTHEVPFSEVSKVCAYMLFYERVSHNK